MAAAASARVAPAAHSMGLTMPSRRRLTRHQRLKRTLRSPMRQAKACGNQRNRRTRRLITGIFTDLKTALEKETGHA